MMHSSTPLPSVPGRRCVNNCGKILCVLFLLGCLLFAPNGISAEGAKQNSAAAHPAGQAADVQSADGEAAESQSAEQQPAEPRFVEPRFVLIPESAKPGEPVTVGYLDADTSGAQDGGPQKLVAVLVDSRARPIARAAFFSLPREEGQQKLMAALLAVPSTALAGASVIRIESSGGVLGELNLTIESREFASETIALNRQNTELRTVPDPQKTAESELLWTILSRTGTEIYASFPFAPPVTSTRRTSRYGDRRLYQYSDGATDTTIHAGIDFGVPEGTRVLASARGKVVLARARIVTGYTVVLEHLPGLYSLYYHMANIAVSEGSIVETGAFLGQSGSTGLATGPHLHWEIRVSGENADPDAFLARVVLDKNEILNKMSK